MKCHFYILISSILYFSCQKTNEKQPQPPNIIKEEVLGLIQKGPFIIGTQVTIFDLDEKFTQTGKSFTTKVETHDGAFKFRNIPLTSGNVEIIASGYYFNENSGKISDGQLILSTITNIKDQSTSLNLNVLTSLQTERTKKLLSDGIKLDNARVQSQKEVLEVFKIKSNNNFKSESLDISTSGDFNSILLATSVILQGNRSTGELSELLSIISSDLKNDGIIQNSIINNQINISLKGLSFFSIRKNLENRYSSIGVTATIPNFESILTPLESKVNDLDGNQYSSYIIGNLEWMAENYKCSKYSNGDVILKASSLIDFSQNIDTGKFVHYNYDTSHNKVYGKLYNFAAINDPRNICPTGWRPANERDFLELITSLGGRNAGGAPDEPLYDNVYDKIRLKGLDLWNWEFGTETNESNFFGVPSGRSYDTIFTGLRESMWFWSIEQKQNGEEVLKKFSIEYKDKLVHIGPAYTEEGLAIRCVKNIK